MQHPACGIPRVQLVHGLGDDKAHLRALRRLFRCATTLACSMCLIPISALTTQPANYLSLVIQMTKAICVCSRSACRVLPSSCMLYPNKNLHALLFVSRSCSTPCALRNGVVTLSLRSGCTKSCIFLLANLSAVSMVCIAGDSEHELSGFTPSFLWLLRDFYLSLEEEGRKVKTCPRQNCHGSPRARPLYVWASRYCSGLLFCAMSTCFF